MHACSLCDCCRIWPNTSVGRPTTTRQCVSLTWRLPGCRWVATGSALLGPTYWLKRHTRWATLDCRARLTYTVRSVWLATSTRRHLTTNDDCLRVCRIDRSMCRRPKSRRSHQMLTSYSETRT